MAPLGDNPELGSVLLEALGRAGTYPLCDGDDIATATERMRNTSKSFRRINKASWACILIVAVFATWMAVAGPSAWRSLKGIFHTNWLANEVGSVCCSFETVPRFPRLGDKEEFWKKTVGRERELRTAPDNRLVLLGNQSASDEVVRWKAVWEAHPQDARHYFAYALEFFKMNARWPEDFVETGERLDSGNGWFRLVDGASKAKSSVGVPKDQPITKAKRLAARADGREFRRPDVKGKATDVILYPKLHAEALVMLEQALAMPRLDDYRQSLDRERFELMPQVGDYREHLLWTMMHWDHPEDSAADWLSLRSYDRALFLDAEAAARRGDRMRLEKLRDLSIHLSEHLVEIGSSYLSKLVESALLMGANRYLAKAWSDMGEAEKSKEFEFVLWKLDPKTSPRPKRGPDALDEQRGSGPVSEGFFGSRGAGSNPVTEPELRGGRLAEYAVYERLMLHVTAVLFFVTLAVLLYRTCLARKKFGLLPDRLAGLLRAGDRLQILGVGVLLPLALYALATGSPWLASRDFTLGQDRFVAWLAQSASLVAVVILWTLQMISRCLGRRGAVLILGWPGMNPGVWLAPVALVTMLGGPTFAKSIPSNDLMEKICWIGFAMMAGLPWLWILGLCGGRFFGSAERKLHRSTIARAMLPFIAVAMVLVALSIPTIYAEERYWVSQMDYEKVTAETNILVPRTELEQAEWLGAQLRRALNEMKLIPRE